MNSWKNLLKCIRIGKESILKLEEKPGQNRWWQIMGSYDKPQKLPEVYRNLLDAFVSTTAHMCDNILDDASRLQKITSIMKRMPVSLLVTSLRFINPAPFIDYCVKLFVWSPSRSVHSLLQRAASHLCGFEVTKKHYEVLSNKISEQNKSLIDDLVSKRRFSSFDSDDQITLIIKTAMEFDIFENNDYDSVEEKNVRTSTDLNSLDIQFARTAIRLAEKNDFVEHEGEESQKNLMIHLLHIMPALMNELQKVSLICSLLYDRLSIYPILFQNTSVCWMGY
ncbi:hypothetical protein BC833DRAFT_318331 [Globomyces pollinis-pini]|nr:hypothetical protein BC833DRAFT_318331 [Globomyces pollinis-pini]